MPTKRQTQLHGINFLSWIKLYQFLFINMLFRYVQFILNRHAAVTSIRAVICFILICLIRAMRTCRPTWHLYCMYGCQATLAFMLDHLKRVSRKSDVNKMTSSALARVFGPLFICPPYRLVRQVPVDLRRHIELLCYVLDIWPPTSRR